MTAVLRFVFDSFALLALFQNEPGADAVEELVHRAHQGVVHLSITTINLGEVIYRTIRDHGLERAEDVTARIEEFGIDVIDVDRDLALAAAHIKATFRMGYADCFVVALAQRLGAAIVTGDPDFQQVVHLVTIEWLPQR